MYCMPQGLLFQSFHDITNIKWSHCFTVTSGTDRLFTNVHQLFIWFGLCIIQPAPNSHWTFLNSWKMFVANPDCSVHVWPLRLNTARWLFFSRVVCDCRFFFTVTYRPLPFTSPNILDTDVKQLRAMQKVFGNGILKPERKISAFWGEGKWLTFQNVEISL